MRTRLALLLMLMLPMFHAAAWAQSEVEPPVGELPEPRMRYLVGAEIVAGPSAWGQTDFKFGLKPMAALQIGRLRISNSGAGALLGGGQGGGASAEFLRTQSWRLSAGLRLDRGRKSSSSGAYADLPDVPGTIRGRLSLAWTPNPRQSVNLALLTDLRNKGVGTIWNLSAAQVLPGSLWGARWSSYATLSGGDGAYLRSHFSVPEAHPRLSAYRPGAGLRDLRVGLGAQRALDAEGHWLLFSQINAGTLLGPAARAPFVVQRHGVGMAVGLAYRN